MILRAFPQQKNQRKLVALHLGRFRAPHPPGRELAAPRAPSAPRGGIRGEGAESAGFGASIGSGTARGHSACAWTRLTQYLRKWDMNP